jgi:dTDP-D-glucose 4,6-dehydratase
MLKTLHENSIRIAGGYEFIGSNFINYLVNQYSELSIIYIDNLTYAA